MTKPKIPKFYKEEEITLYDEKVKISSYRVIDNEYAIPFIKKQIELEEYQKNKKTQSNEKTAELVGELEELAHPLAQRGLKRFYYPETRNYKELDQIQDIEMDPATTLQIAGAMIGLGIMGKSRGEKEKKPQKAVKSTQKKSSTTSKTESN